jgi:hypothetical protein
VDCVGIWLIKKLWVLVRRFLDTTYILWPTFLLADFTVACGNPAARKDPIHASLVIAMAAHASREFGRGLSAAPDLSKALCDLCKRCPVVCQLITLSLRFALWHPWRRGQASPAFK